MRITESNSKLQVALAVVRRVDIPSKDVCIKAFTNCREQGLHIVHYGSNVLKRRAVSVAEHSSSDDIVVYYGLSDDFDYIHNCPKTDEAWDKNKHFAFGDYEGAATFITKYLRKQVC